MANQGGNMKKESFCFSIIILWQLSNFVFGAIPASERAALIALYNSTNGDRWYHNNGWKTAPLHSDGFALPGTEQSWHGVNLSGDHVHAILLHGNHLHGSIPPELGNISDLSRLYLRENQLSGSIPKELGNLSNLCELVLDHNQLSGSIPPGIGNLSNLESLDLSRNQLSGRIPKELCNLSNLEYFYLSYNQLSGSIPKELGNLRNLYGLLLDNNQLSGSIPKELCNLSNLCELVLDHNQLSGSILSELANLRNLEELSLSHNQLSGRILPRLGNINNLGSLDLCWNQLSGSIPPELGNLRNLWLLKLDNNHLSGSIPPELGNLRNLHELYLGYNQLSGSIPSNFINLVNLYYYCCFDVSYNCLFAADSALRDWLKKYDWYWEETQCLEKAPPFGYFETPIHGSTVCSNIAVTGWALDDYGMAGVKIYREQENTLVFIGDAIFVEGARPDVEAAYPGYPENYRAGWGYMMLTHFLPNGGNGTYVLHAIATDRYGKTTTLGTKTIIVDNAHAVKPFGAIDTPIQGEMLSDTGFINWGWALTPPPNKIPIDGTTIDVYIDGVKAGHPTYNIYRPDIASLFPNYANSNGASGYFYLKPLEYWDGLHTIQWTAIDNAGNIDSISSRYFRIENYQPGSIPATAGPLPGFGRHTGQIPGRIRHEENFGELLPVKGDFPRHTIQELALMPEEKGMNELIIKEMDRVEIKLGENHGDILGYLLCGDELKKLPIGSTLDAKTGTFYWSPGPGFLGRYSLVFVLTGPDGRSYKKSIEIEIVPRFNGLWPTD